MDDFIGKYYITKSYNWVFRIESIDDNYNCSVIFVYHKKIPSFVGKILKWKLSHLEVSNLISEKEFEWFKLLCT